MISLVSAVPSPRLPRALLITSLAAALATSACADPSTARAPAPDRETADWVPFKGSIPIGRTWGHPGGHAFPAVDFEVPAGGSIRVYAAGPGTLFASGGDCPDTTPSGEHAACNGGNGNFVDIIHPDGRRSRYLHLREGSVVVAPGEHVCRGCLIGRSGWSGNVVPSGPEGAHLHYEELVGYTLVPPGPMFAQGRLGRVSYPDQGRTWQDIGVENPLVVNRGFPAPDPAPRGECFGWAPTIVGTGGHDDIRGTRGHDVIITGEGNDTIHGAEGEDRICAGAGNDVVAGGEHPDRVDGGEGADTCYQGEINGLLNAGPGSVISCERPTYVLTVASEDKVITSQPSGIACPSDCTQTFVTHTTVILTVTSGGLYRWAGCDTLPESSTCAVTMTHDRTVRV